jgi:hypothetical protein
VLLLLLLLLPVVLGAETCRLVPFVDAARRARAGSGAGMGSRGESRRRCRGPWRGRRGRRAAVCMQVQRGVVALWWCHAILTYIGEGGLWVEGRPRHSGGCCCAFDACSGEAAGRIAASEPHCEGYVRKERYEFVWV